MDLFLLYLRKVHAFDYFTCMGYESERILTLKTSSAFLRAESEQEELENVPTVFRKIQERAEDIIEKGSGARDYGALIRESIEKYFLESETGPREVWKCLSCEKKFKTCDFLVKHVIAKHEDIKFKVTFS